MEPIRQAVERARAGGIAPRTPISENLAAPSRRTDSAPSGPTRQESRFEELELNPDLLQSKRIVAFNGADLRSRPYDMLRTQVLQAMGVGGWQVLGVTSPTPGCGKTVTATNLAFSIARQRDQSVVLIDADLQRPQVANSLGLQVRGGGLLDILEERTNFQDATVPIRVGRQRLAVLPTSAIKVSSELMGSRAMRDLLQDINRNYKSHIMIVDLPPLLVSDDVIAILPQIDCVLLVAAVGQTKVSEIVECNRHLQSSHLVRVVVNKSRGTDSKDYYY
jgi:protein-tyrosine kinase